MLNWQNRRLEGLVAHLATPLKSLLEGEAKTREDETSHKWRRVCEHLEPADRSIYSINFFPTYYVSL